jgi:hypothetical protein
LNSCIAATLSAHIAEALSKNAWVGVISNMNKDRYNFLGRKVRARSFETALESVLEVWPGAFAEGSIGSERTFFVWVSGELGLVAHCWPVRGSDDEMHLRILGTGKTPVLDSMMPLD